MAMHIPLNLAEVMGGRIRCYERVSGVRFEQLSLWAAEPEKHSVGSSVRKRLVRASAECGSDAPIRFNSNPHRGYFIG